MNSRLYECRVLHARFVPKPHRFAYRIFMLAIDLDELPSLQRRFRLLSVNRPNLYSFRESDCLPTPEPLHNPSEAAHCHVLSDKTSAPSAATPEPVCHVIRDKPAGNGAAKVGDDARLPRSLTSSTVPDTSAVASGRPISTLTLKERVIAYLAERSVDLGPRGRVELITLPRIAGYLFNPVSFYFCYDSSGVCVASLAEVTNTFREVKPYFLGPQNRRAPASARGLAAFHLRTPKHFYVSPFSDVDVAFDFQLRAPAERLSIQIDDYIGPQRTLTSTLAGRAAPLTDARLAWFTLKYPLLTVRVITLIHWHALLLYLKKIPWFSKAARAADQRDLYRPHASLSPSRPQDA